MSVTLKTLKQVSQDFMKRVQATGDLDLTQESVTETFDREIRQELFKECDRLVDTSVKANIRAIKAIDSALFDSFLNKHRAASWRAQDAEIRRFIGVGVNELAVLRTDPATDLFFKKVYLNSETLNKVLNLLKMADFYAGVKPDKGKENLNISSIIWEPKTPFSYKSESYTCRFLKTCVRLASSYANESFTSKDAWHLVSKLSLMLVLRSNPILGLVMPVGSVLTSSIAIPAISKVLSITGAFSKAESGLTKHQLLAFNQTHTDSLDHMQRRAETLFENINRTFDLWLANEDDDEELILRECLRIEIENFEADNLVRPFGDEYIMQDLEDGWTKIDLKPK
jgi:hypothetical protein